MNRPEGRNTYRRYAVMAFVMMLSLSSQVVVNATPSPTRSCANAIPSRRSHVFGIPISWPMGAPSPPASQKRAPGFAPSPLIQLRGGDLHVAESLTDVESIILKAGMENKLVVIDFTATWCGPCKAIAPLFKELSEEMSDVVFIKVDVDENPETAAKYSVSAMPTFLFIKGGEVLDRLMGASPSRLQEMIQEYM